MGKAIAYDASQVAIPLMTMTSARVSYLYDLMDAAYDAAAIHDQDLGARPRPHRRPQLSRRPRRQGRMGPRGRVRLKLIHMPDFDDLIYDFLLWPNASTPG